MALCITLQMELPYLNICWHSTSNPTGNHTLSSVVSVSFARKFTSSWFDQVQVWYWFFSAKHYGQLQWFMRPRISLIPLQLTNVNHTNWSLMEYTRQYCLVPASVCQANLTTQVGFDIHHMLDSSIGLWARSSYCKISLVSQCSLFCYGAFSITGPEVRIFFTQSKFSTRLNYHNSRRKKPCQILRWWLCSIPLSRRD